MINRLFRSLSSQRTVFMVFWSIILVAATSCEKDSLMPDARLAVLPSGDTIAIDCGDDISERRLPDAVRDAVAADFPGWYIDEVERCDGGTGMVLYLIELDTDGDDYRYVVYTEDGTLLDSFGDDDDWYSYGSGYDEEFFVSDDGTRIRVDCDDDVPVSALPTAVRDAIDAAYPDYRIDDVERCDASGPGSFWLVELERPNGEDRYVGYDDAGNAYRYVDRD